MPKTSATATDAALRNNVFAALNIANVEGFQKINNRQYGVLMTDANGVQRYIRVSAIVAEVRDDMTAAELMQEEIDKYHTALAKEEKVKAERAEKAAPDKAERERKKKEKEAAKA